MRDFAEDTGVSMPEPGAGPSGEGGDIKGQDESNLEPAGGTD